MKKYLLIASSILALKLQAQTYRLDIKNSNENDSIRIMDLFFQSGNLRYFTVINTTSNDPVKRITLKSDLGEIRKIEKMYLLSPNDTTGMKISVFKNKELLAEAEFKTIPVPVPAHSFYLLHKNQDLIHGSQVTINDSISVKFVVDSLYSLKCPEDIKYKASEVTIVKNGNIRTSLKVDGQFQLNKFNLNPGETIKLELNKYKRINFAGQEFETDASPEDFVILKIE